MYDAKWISIKIKIN